MRYAKYIRNAKQLMILCFLYLTTCAFELSFTNSDIHRCGHDCCKNGIPVKPRASAKLLSNTQAAAKTPTKQKLLPKSHRPADRMSSYVSQLHARAPATPVLNRIKVCAE